MLLGLLKRIVARRQLLAASGDKSVSAKDASSVFKHNQEGTSYLNEVKEIISLPAFDGSVTDPQDPDKIQISEVAQEQLRACVSSITGLCRDNAFHK